MAFTPFVIVCNAGFRYRVVGDASPVAWLAEPLFGRNRRARLVRKAGTKAEG